MQQSNVRLRSFPQAMGFSSETDDPHLLRRLQVPPFSLPPFNPTLASVYDSDAHQTLEDALERLLLTPSPVQRSYSGWAAGEFESNGFAFESSAAPVDVYWPRSSLGFSSGQCNLSERDATPDSIEHNGLNTSCIFGVCSPELHGSTARPVAYSYGVGQERAVADVHTNLDHSRPTMYRPMSSRNSSDVDRWDFVFQNGLTSSPRVNNSRVQTAVLSYVEGIRGRVVLIAKHQEYFRDLVSCMDRMEDREIEAVFLEIVDHVGSLMLDPFGHFVVEKLIELCSANQRTHILYLLTRHPHLLRICSSSYGTRSIQKLLDKLTGPQQKSAVIHALAPFMVKLIKDPIGHHVIRHCLKVFTNEENEFLFGLVADKCYDIATDKSGCCVLQQCVEHAQGKQRDLIVSRITGCALHLAENRYGNYVVQHLLALEIPHAIIDVHRQFLGNYATLSCNKYGSNVVEKCLKEASFEQFTDIAKELIYDFLTVVLNEFGNYVIQRAMEVSKAEGWDQISLNFMMMFKDYSAPIWSNPFGKKAVLRLEKQNLLPRSQHQ